LLLVIQNKIYLYLFLPQKKVAGFATHVALHDLYSTTAHAACLFQSSDLCEMNVVSTAFVLPRTPADVNGVLSIVFVGAGKSEPDQLGLRFRARKDQILGVGDWRLCAPLLDDEAFGGLSQTQASLQVVS
jgi:hypothetical protein